MVKKQPGETNGDQFGYSVSSSLDGKIVAIGSIYNDGNGNNSGHVRIFEWSGSAWTKKITGKILFQ